MNREGTQTGERKGQWGCGGGWAVRASRRPGARRQTRSRALLAAFAALVPLWLGSAGQAAMGVLTPEVAS